LKVAHVLNSNCSKGRNEIIVRTQRAGRELRSYHVDRVTGPPGRTHRGGKRFSMAPVEYSRIACTTDKH
jgi:hypothetical protein